MPAKTPMNWIAQWLRVVSRSTDADTPAAGYAAFYAKSKSPYFVNEDGTVTALAAGAGDVVGPASATDGAVALFDTATGKLLKNGTVLPTLATGTYTPSLTNTTNIDASTAFACQYMRVGNVVTVSGKVQIDTTTTGSTVMGISLPIASTFATDNLCAGTGVSTSSTTTEAGRILGDTTNNRALWSHNAVTVTNLTWGFTFTYLVA